MRIDIPSEFRPNAVQMYPSYCTANMVEQYVSDHFKETETDRIYLPIYWTNYYCQKEYGKGNIIGLYKFLDSLDKSKRYFSVCQYDDGIIDKPHDLDLLLFSAGHPSGIPIPLLPSHYLDAPDIAKEYDLSFIGNAGTHSVRKEAIEETGCWKLDGLTPEYYYRSLAKSEFTLCPRGYGVTSFRLYEALHCGAIPVYVSDVHWLPAERTIDWNKLAILVRPNELHTIRYKMLKHVQDWDYYNEIKDMFTMQGTLDYIKGFLRGEFENRNK